ncbi:MAG: O-antigen ligase family protein [Chloroflexota bacterium]|nr:O-antigen ligase family protein [Chloroflexota bacterium]
MKRDALLLIVALVALAGSLFAAWGTDEQRRNDLRGYANPALEANLPYYLPRFGVNADLTQYNSAELERQLVLMQSINVVWVRQFIESLPLASQAEDYDWSQLDGIVSPFRHHPTLEFVIVLPVTGALDPADFAASVSMFANRYGSTVDYYQIGDEPNLYAAWGNAEPRVQDYAALLEAAYAAIHSADADATVIAAALAPTLETGPRNISDLLYLEDLYRLGLANFSDAIAAKPYGFSAPPTEPASPDLLNFQRVVLLRHIMLRYGDGQSSIWASQWGWNSLPSGWAGEPSLWGQVTAQQQTDYTKTALSMVQEDFPWLAGMILESWQPAVAPADPRWGFALTNDEDGPTPLFQSLTGAPPSAAPLGFAPIGLHHPASPFVRYSGVWTVSERGADIGWVGDSQLEFDFTGDSISLLAREDDYTAYLYVTVNGLPANALPRDSSGNAYLVLTSDTLEPETRLIPLAHELGAGNHTLRIVADRGWDRWALAGFAVGGSDRVAPYLRQIALALLSAGIAAAAAVVFARQINWRSTLRPFAGIGAHLGDAGQFALGAIASVVLMIGMLLTWHNATSSFFRRESIQLGLAIASAGLLYVNPALPVSITAGLLLFVLFYHRPLHGLMLTIFFAPFYLFPVELYRFAFPMSELLVLITFMAWSVRTAVQAAAHYRQQRTLATTEQGSQRINTIDLLMIAFLALGVVSLVWAEYRDVAVTELRVLFIEPCLFYLMLRTSRLTQRDWLKLIDTLVIAGIAVAAIGLFQYVRGDSIITAEDGARRLASVYGSPNNVGLWLGRCLPFALIFMLAPLDRNRRIFGTLAVLIFAAALVLTLSAGALFLGIPAAVAVVLMAHFGRRALLPLGGLTLLGAAALPILSQSARFARLLDPSEGTNFFRLRVWQSALAAIQDRPLTGLGLDQFLYVFRGRYILPDAWQEPNLSHPHNFILDFWLRLGMMGVILLLAFLALLAARFIRVIRTATDSMQRVLAIGAAGCLANMLVHGLVDNSLFVNDLIYVFMLLSGLAIALKHDENHSSLNAG